MSALLACALFFGYWLGANSSAPTATIARDSSGNIVETDTTNGPGLTTTRAVYDGKTLMLLHAQSHCDCDGAPLDTTIDRSGGTAYTFQTKTGGSAPKDEKHTVVVPNGDLLVTGNEMLVPMMVAHLHVTEVQSVAYNPIELVPEQVAVEAGERPADMPAGDIAVSVRPRSDRHDYVTRWLWYDPCTYRVDGIDVSTMSIQD